MVLEKSNQCKPFTAVVLLSPRANLSPRKSKLYLLNVLQTSCGETRQEIDNLLGILQEIKTVLAKEDRHSILTHLSVNEEQSRRKASTGAGSRVGGAGRRTAAIYKRFRTFSTALVT